MKNLWLIFRIFAITTGYSTLGIFLSMFPGWHGRFFKYARKWAASVLRTAGITVSAEGQANIPATSCVYVCNHASLFDIPILIAGINDDIRIMYKRELRTIPFFGWVLALSPFIPIDRADPRDAMAGIERAAAAIREGSSVIIFAEGTRSPDGVLGAFKRGAFVLAMRAQRPIVPVAIAGSSAILPSKTSRITPGHVRLVIKPAMEVPAAYDRALEKALMNDVRSAIAAELDPAPHP